MPEIGQAISHKVLEKLGGGSKSGSEYPQLLVISEKGE